jgi:hypothetical protein
MRILGPLLLTLLTLVACSKPESTQEPGSKAPGEVAATPISKQMSGVVASPLNDLNLVRAKIPPVLLLAQKAPYAPPAEPSCDGLASEIRQLDAALGADLDAPSTPGEHGLVERGQTEAGEAAVGVVRHTAEGLIPFRGWVRKLSGAERYSKQVLDAITAGIIRRAYLKGLGQAKGCPAPAAPLPPSPPGPAPVSIDKVKEPDSR